MASQPIEQRVVILEGKVQKLEELPPRVDRLELQFSQFREEVRAEFSATRQEMNQRFDAVDQRLGRVDQRLDSLDRRLDDLGRHMRVLHEDVIARIALIGEGRPRRKK